MKWLVASSVVVAALGLAVPARASGIDFKEGPLAPMLEQAKKEKKRVFVEVWATWCNPCKRQRADVLDTADGAALTQGMLAWRVDFDAPDQRELMEKWAVLALPTILVLRPDGTEVDRIEGYEVKEDFLVDARRIVKGEDSLPELQKKLLLSKDPAERMRVQVEIAHKQLVRGETTAAALAAFERIATEDADGKAGAAEDALFFTGRYLSRVKHDDSHARHVWRELAMRFPDGKYARTADWWYAGALHTEGLDDVATVFLARRARQKPDADTLDNVVGFAVEKSGDRKSAKIVVDELDKTGKIKAEDVAKQRARLADPNVQKTGS